MKNLFLLFAIILAACSPSHPIASFDERQLPDSAASCANILRVGDGRLLLSYVSDINDSVSEVRYCFSGDDGLNFDPPRPVPGSRSVHRHAENLPKMIVRGNGDIIAVWGAAHDDPRNRYAGKIHYAQSFDNGMSWTDPVPLVADTSSYDQRYFDVALLSNGEAGIVWLDSRGKEGAGSTVYFATTSGKDGFSGEQRVAHSICPCCRTDAFVSADGRIHLAFRDIINDSIRDMVHCESADNGRTFTIPQRISPDDWVINGCPHTGPSMTANGGMHFAWYTGDEGAGVYYAALKEKRFTPRSAVSTASSARHPQVASAEGAPVVIVWDETIKHNGDYNVRIGMQLRDPVKGGIIRTEYLTSPSIKCEYPVLVMLEDNNALVVWNRSGGRREVCYKRVRI